MGIEVIVSLGILQPDHPFHYSSESCACITVDVGSFGVLYSVL